MQKEFLDFIGSVKYSKAKKLMKGVGESGQRIQHSCTHVSKTEKVIQDKAGDADWILE